MRNFHTVFQNDCTNLLSPQGCPCFFFAHFHIDNSHPNGCGLICNFRMISDVKHLWPFVGVHTFWILTSNLTYGLRIFSPLYYIYVILFLLFLLQCGNLLVCCSFSCLLCFCCLCFICIQVNHSWDQGQGAFSPYFLLGALWLQDLCLSF